MVTVDYFIAPWLDDGSVYGHVPGQEWINATAPSEAALAELICGAYNAHHTGEHPEADPDTGKPRLWRVDEFDLVEVNPPQ